MRTIILLALAATLGLFGQNLRAQEVESNEEKIEFLQQQKDEVIVQEKAALRQEVEAIMRRREKQEITADEAETLKKAAAEKAALNIENKTAILDNQIALLTRNAEDEKDNGFKLSIGFGGRESNGERTWGVHFKDDRRGSSRNMVSNHYRRTRSDFVFAFGLNNAIADGEGINDSPYKVGGSRFAELGWAWTTRVFDNAGWLRVKYGLSFQFNGLKPEGNRVFVKNEQGIVVLQDFEQDLDKSKLRLDNLVVPFHLEFGPARKRYHEDRVSYSTHNRIKIGLGGYAGLNLGARQKLKFKKDGDNIKQKQKGGFNTNNFVYGLSGYLGWDNMGIYVKYDLNPIFKDNPVEERNVSLGLRFDLD